MVARENRTECSPGKIGWCSQSVHRDRLGHAFIQALVADVSESENKYRTCKYRSHIQRLSWLIAGSYYALWAFVVVVVIDCDDWLVACVDG